MVALFEDLRGLRFGTAVLNITKVVKQNNISGESDPVFRQFGTKSYTNRFSYSSKDVMYVGLKRGEEMVHGIPVSTALGLSVFAGLVIAAWNVLT